MNNPITFTNVGNGVTYSLDISKNLVFVFGGNGSGKTTCSRAFGEECAVFNEDYIQKNVYVTESDGADISKDNKENFSNIFLGELATSSEKKLEAEQIKKKECSKLQQAAQLLVTSELQKRKVPLSPSLATIANSGELSFDFGYDPLKTLDENKKSLGIKNKLPCTISSENDFDEKVKEISNSDTILKLLAKLKSNDFSRSVFFDSDKEKDLRALIDNYNKNIDAIKSQETAFGSFGVDAGKVKKWVEDGLILHKDLDQCIFCSSTKIAKKKEDWRGKIENDLVMTKKKLLDYLNNAIRLLSSFESETVLDVSCKKTKSAIASANTRYQSYKERAEKNIRIDFTPFDFPIDTSVLDIDELGKQIGNYYVNNHLSDLMFPFFVGEKIAKEIESLQKTIDSEIDKISNSTEKAINDTLEELGSSIKIGIKKDNMAGKRKIRLSPENREEIGNCSDGEKHQIALAVFFANLQSKPPKEKIVVLDDPVVSLDVSKYYKLRNFIVLRRIPDEFKLVVLTHNFHYLLIQTSNILGNKDLCNESSLWMFNHSKKILEQQDFGILQLDDFVLVKKALRAVTTLDECSYIYWSFLKIARSLVDLKLRFIGEASLDDPSVEISVLCSNGAISLESSSILQNNLTNLAHLAKEKNVKVSDLLNEIDEVNGISTILGMPVLFTEDDCSGLHSINENGDVPENPAEADSLLFEILNSGKKTFFNSLKKAEQNYINHPRHQITESLLEIFESSDFSD